MILIPEGITQKENSILTKIIWPLDTMSLGKMCQCPADIQCTVKFMGNLQEFQDSFAVVGIVLSGWTINHFLHIYQHILKRRSKRHVASSCTRCRKDYRWDRERGSGERDIYKWRPQVLIRWKGEFEWCNTSKIPNISFAGDFQEVNSWKPYLLSLHESTIKMKSLMQLFPIFDNIKLTCSPRRWGFLGIKPQYMYSK